MVSAEQKDSALQSRLECRFSALQQRVGSHAQVAAKLAAHLAAFSQEAEKLAADLLANLTAAEPDLPGSEIASVADVDDGFNAEPRDLIAVDKDTAGNGAAIMEGTAKAAKAGIMREEAPKTAEVAKGTICPRGQSNIEAEKVQDKTNDMAFVRAYSYFSSNGGSPGNLSDQTPPPHALLPGEADVWRPEDDISMLRVSASSEDDHVSSPEEQRGSSKASTWTGVLFADPEELKAKIRENLSKPPYDVKNFYHESGVFQHVARSRVFEVVSLLVVSLNSLWISIDLDLNEAESLIEADAIFQVAAHSFCIFFCAELLVRFLAFEQKKNAAQDFWFVFDLVMVLGIVVDTWIMTALLAIVNAGNEANQNTRILVVFRTFRLLRVARLVRVMRTIPEVMVILRGIGIALRAILVVLLLIGFIIYIAAIVLRVVLEDTAIGTKLFGSIPSCMGVLLLDGTLSGSKGVPIMYEANDESFVYSVLIFLFVLIANITCMGVLTGLLVQTVKTVAECEHEEKAMKSMQKSLNQLWEHINEHDTDGNGLISHDELQSMLKDKRYNKILHNLDVNVEGVVNVAGFALENAGGELSKTAFKQMILDLRNKNVAKVKDIVETRKYIYEELKRAGLIEPTMSESPKARLTTRSIRCSSGIREHTVHLQ